MILHECEFDESSIENKAGKNGENTDRVRKFPHASYRAILRLLKRAVKSLK